MDWRNREYILVSICSSSMGNEHNECRKELKRVSSKLKFYPPYNHFKGCKQNLPYENYDAKPSKLFQPVWMISCDTSDYDNVIEVLNKYQIMSEQVGYAIGYRKLTKEALGQ